MYSRSLQRSGFVITSNEAGAQFWSVPQRSLLIRVADFEIFQTLL